MREREREGEGEGEREREIEIEGSCSQYTTARNFQRGSYIHLYSTTVEIIFVE